MAVVFDTLCRSCCQGTLSFSFKNQFQHLCPPGEGVGVLPQKLYRGARPASKHPYPIHDQYLRYSLPYLWPHQILETLFMTAETHSFGAAHTCFTDIREYPLVREGIRYKIYQFFLSVNKVTKLSTYHYNKNLPKIKGAFHSTKNSGLNFRNFRMSPNGTVFSTRPDRSHSFPAWAHFPPRITRQNAERSRWSGS